MGVSKTRVDEQVLICCKRAVRKEEGKRGGIEGKKGGGEGREAG